MNLIVLIIFSIVVIYVYFRFSKRGKRMYTLQSPQELLYNIHTEINDELKLFIDKHDFSLYRPNVGVFGENSTGKSTFLNAILGNKNEFKMGFGETTNKITVLYKHDKPIVIGKSKFNQLYSKRDYKKINYRHLDYMNLFDIPGFGQYFSHDELTKVIQEIDIVFWFIDVSKGVKRDDKLFLKSIKGLDTKVIIVLNKIDAILENNEIDDLTKDIHKEIIKIKTFFKEESVLDNLVTIFPFSATKSLVGTIKGEQGAFKVIDKIVENVLLYTVFIESYRSCIEYYLENNINFVNFEFDILDIISDTTIDLEYNLKNNISFGSSLNPFSSKDEVAKPIVSTYIFILKSRLNQYNKEFVQNIQKDIQENLDNSSSFEAFGEVEKLDFKLAEFELFNTNIDLESIAWDNFFGDSFSEKVADKFKRKITKKVKRQIPNIVNKYDKNISLILNQLNKDSQTFATSLDHKLANITEKIQKPMLVLLLKAVQNKLDTKDDKFIKKMLEI